MTDFFKDISRRLQYTDYPNELIKIVTDAHKKSAIANIGSMLVYVWAMNVIVPDMLILGWFVCHSIYFVVRSYIFKQLSHALENEPEKITYYLGIIIALIGFSSVLWGCAAWLAVVYAPMAYIFLTLTILLGLAGGAIASLSSVQHIYVAFTFPMLTLQFTALLYAGENIYFFVAILLFIYTLVVYKSSRALYSYMLDEIEQRKKVEKAKQEADQANRIKSAFLANMSHEVRTPMNAILGFSRLAHRNAENKIQKNYLNKIYTSSESLLGILNDILDSSKMEANKLVLEKVPFDVNTVVNQVCNLMQDKAEQQGIELLSYVPSNISRKLIGDPLRLSQILTNFVSNAVKFTRQGEVFITVNSVPEQTVCENGMKLLFEIKDTGIGMEAEEIKTIFNTFSQADISTTRKFGGTGLGLAICKNLVTQMGGKIAVQSQKNIGSIFSFILEFPFDKDKSKIFIPAFYNTEKKNVLIVTANKTAALVLAKHLDWFSWESKCVLDGRAVIDLFEQAYENQQDLTYDMILIDYLRLDIGGESIADYNTLLQRQKKIPIVMITSTSMYEKMIPELESSHKSYVLFKPVNQNNLFSTIKNALDNQSAQDIDSPTELSFLPSTKLLQKIAGSKVLLVDDSEINQQLASEILKSWGISVAIANNGKQSIEMLQQKKFDLVLMDIHMPEMDGYEATHIIRNLQNLSNIPIIAMTALAMSGDREKVIAKGMNDYISKPFKIKSLFNTLCEWIIIENELSETEIMDKIMAQNEVPPENEKEILPITIKGIELNLGLENALNNKTLYRSLLTTFKERLDNDVPKVKILLTNKNSTKAYNIIHNIKGISGNLGAVKLSTASAELIHSIKNEDGEAIAKTLNAFNDCVKVLQYSLYFLDSKQSNESNNNEVNSYSD